MWPAIVAHAINNVLGVTLAVAGAARATVPPPRPSPWQLAGRVLTLVLAGGLLSALGASYRRATPEPPGREALARVDPAIAPPASTSAACPAPCSSRWPSLAALVALALPPARR